MALSEKWALEKARGLMWNPKYTGFDPFAALGKAMTKHAPTPNPYCGINGGCTTWCGDIACKRHKARLTAPDTAQRNKR